MALRVSAAVVVGALLAFSLTMSAAQAPTSAPAGQPTFEVASVKSHGSIPGERRLAFMPNGRFLADNVPLRSLIATAYGDPRPLPGYRIIGGPGWLESEAFDIEAKAADSFANAPAAFADTGRLMLRALLAERFDLVVRQERRAIPVYALTLARRDGRTGPALRAAAGEDCVPAPPPGQPPTRIDLPPCGVARGMGPGKLAGYSATFDQIARILELGTDRPVTNRIAQTGTFTFALEFTPTRTGPSTDAAAGDTPAVSIFTAVQEQLGLRLEPSTSEMDVLVIERVERPSQN
jgi:bla regulator protein blaR1